MIHDLAWVRERGSDERALVDDLLARVDGCPECARRVWLTLVERYLRTADPGLGAGEATRFAEDKALYWIAVGLEAGSTFTGLRTHR